MAYLHVLICIVLGQIGVAHAEKATDKKKSDLKAMFEPEQSAPAQSVVEKHAPRAKVSVEAGRGRAEVEPQGEPDPDTAFILIQEKGHLVANNAKEGAIKIATGVLNTRTNELRAKCLKVSYVYSSEVDSPYLFNIEVFFKCLPRPVADVGPLLRQFKCEEITNLPAKDLTPAHTEQFKLLDCLGERTAVVHRAVPPTKWDELKNIKLMSE